MRALLLLLVVFICLPAAQAKLYQKTQNFTLPNHIAPNWRYVYRLNGLCGGTCRNGPENMYTASFENTLLVAYQAIHEQDKWRTEGHLATYNVDSEGAFSLISDVKLPLCWKVGGVTASEDGKVIGLLCRGLVDTHAESQGDPPGVIDFLEKYRTAPDSQCTEWKGRCYPMGYYSETDSPLYLLEWTGGSVDSTPDSTVLINHASGGANYGHLSIDLNADASMYFLDIKITLGPTRTNRHQGNIHYGIKRADWTRDSSLTDGFACGGGHTISNRLAYNKALGTFSRYCMIDTAHEVRWGTTPTARNSDAHILTPNFGGTYSYDGGAMNVVSLGSNGWMVSAVGPDVLSFTSKAATRVGVMRLPNTHEEWKTDHARMPAAGQHDASKCRENGEVDNDCCAANGAGSCADGYFYHYTGENCVSHYRMFQCWAPGSFTPIDYQYKWKWMVTPPKTSSREPRMGMINLANLGKGGETSGRLLLGWSPAMATQGITDEYMVQEIDIDGNFQGEPLRLQNAGWGEDNEWVHMPGSGCVVFPFAWKEGATGPGENFPLYGAEQTTKVMHMTSICPDPNSASSSTAGRLLISSALFLMALVTLFL